MMKLILCGLAVFLISLSLSAQENAVRILEEHTLTEAEISDIIAQYPELANCEIASERYLESENQKFTLKLYAQNTNDVFIFEKTAEKISVHKSTVPFEVMTRPFEGAIEGQLFETILKDTKNEKIAAQVANAFKDDLVSTRGLKVQARYKMEVMAYVENNELIKYGEVQNASLIVGSAISERTLQQDFSTLNWQLAPVRPELEQRPFYTPVKASRVSSLFNLARKHPVKHRIQPHNGIDFVAKSGTPVFPALDGQIVAMGRARAKGKFILIQHENGYQTTYDHLKKFTKGLRVGMHVELNDQIGTVGRTGFATGAHLHFGVIHDGLYVNPIYLVKDYTFDQKDSFENGYSEADNESED